ncbi:hypothetical protein TpMuguga_01g00378 [Theileria parva strain Muguga]|uniref:CD8+ T cell target antigen Tp9 n=1 Tax=Theileria parva TaxID=5875 RepID=Q4N8T6_THEPA|nr:uncharacterized protein TpMuguga_01g00378 [Theileria parva strain Muguga]EAN33622.1 hypothetical protein TpMuguga_01g00378 [Theileria parva strain Muguga]|eukprot:XP_765905.1 hypothetical protein [Theileria parva strain Muguga]
MEFIIPIYLLISLWSLKVCESSDKFDPKSTKNSKATQTSDTTDTDNDKNNGTSKDRNKGKGDHKNEDEGYGTGDSDSDVDRSDKCNKQGDVARPGEGNRPGGSGNDKLPPQQKNNNLVGNAGKQLAKNMRSGDSNGDKGNEGNKSGGNGSDKGPHQNKIPDIGFNPGGAKKLGGPPIKPEVIKVTIIDSEDEEEEKKKQEEKNKPKGYKMHTNEELEATQLGGPAYFDDLEPKNECIIS